MDASELAAEHGRYLWSLCYRLTGSAADADDLLQETWLRAIERPPAREADPIRPWLVRVALNLGRDLLRARRRRAYDGPWLPSPIEPDEEPEIAAPVHGAESRYELVESVTFAFLLALEALTPNQRAVLLLCDVFDYSVREAAELLDLSEPNVKVLHHRARRVLAAYDRDRMERTPELVARTGEALQRFLGAIAMGDASALQATLAAEARQMSDGGGEFFAARVQVTGRAKVAQLFLGLRKQGPPPLRYVVRMLNGLPAFVVERPAVSRMAPRFIVQCEIDEAGLIRTVYTVLATRKLTALRPVT
ncbi:RNA polymerase sigma-70 factor, ECF subfamily protein [Minicystis rosea]|nr:RNA polymerase sigma-70 factor, ECF subfamily protein [Minicystis rosea]